MINNYVEQDITRNNKKICLHYFLSSLWHSSQVMVMVLVRIYSKSKSSRQIRSGISHLLSPWLMLMLMLLLMLLLLLMLMLMLMLMVLLRMYNEQEQQTGYKWYLSSLLQSSLLRSFWRQKATVVSCMKTASRLPGWLFNSCFCTAAAHTAPTNQLLIKRSLEI